MRKYQLIRHPKLRMFPVSYGPVSQYVGSWDRRDAFKTLVRWTWRIRRSSVLYFGCMDTQRMGIIALDCVGL